MLRGLTTINLFADPFGTIPGVMYNAHDLEILGYRSGSMLGE